MKAGYENKDDLKSQVDVLSILCLDEEYPGTEKIVIFALQQNQNNKVGVYYGFRIDLSRSIPGKGCFDLSLVIRGGKWEFH